MNSSPHEFATYREILSQPSAWREALEVIDARADALRALWTESPPFDEVLFTGCGSTYYLSVAAAALWQTLLDLPARAQPAGELYLHPDASYGPGIKRRTLLVAVSRSGTTSETIAAVEQFKRRKQGAVIAITNYPGTPLDELGDVTVAIPAGQEESLAQTRSFTSMYVATTALAAQLAGEQDLLAAMGRLPGMGEALLNRSEPLAKALGEDLALERFYFLGSGPRYGLACEVNLKLKEMTRTDSEPFHFFEFRHGPMSMVNARTAVIGLLSEERHALEGQVLEEMRALGGRIVSLGEDGADISFDSDLPVPVRNVLYLPALQLTAFYRALAKGLNPDQPANLTAVITLELAL